VRDICVACCWMGEYAPERIPDDWIWAEHWTRYFTDREPEHTWVVERTGDDEVAGYLTGTPDAARAGRYAARRLPGIVAHAVRKRLMRKPQSRAAILAMLRSVLRGQMRLPRRVRKAYPATFHFNLLPEARRRGLGSRLFDLFIERMRSLGVPGVHEQVLAVNPAVPGFLAARGFGLVAARPVTVWRHLDKHPIELQTWVRSL